MLILAAESNSVLIPPLGELVVGTLAFLIFFGLLARRAIPQIEKVYAERRDRIEGGMLRAEEAQAEAQRTLEEYRRQLAEARSEAGRLRTEGEAERQKIIDAARNEAREEAARVTRQADERLTAERTQLVAELRREVGALAVSLAGRIVGESLQDQARQERMVERFLDELDGMAGPGEERPPTLVGQA